MRMLFDKLVNRYVKSIKTARLQGGFDKTFCKMVESPTWEALCRQVFDQYLGQLSFTPVTQIHLLVEKLPITSRSHVLELAPGTGGLSLHLAKLTGCRLIGLDASPLAVKIANRRAMLRGLAERVHFEVGILPELPYQDCSFDFVICARAKHNRVSTSGYRNSLDTGYRGLCRTSPIQSSKVPRKATLKTSLSQLKTQLTHSRLIT